MTTHIEGPAVSTPADEWAANTTDALHSKSQTTLPSPPQAADPENPSSTVNPGLGPQSVVSTPGLELPGAFPKESTVATTASAHKSVQERTPQAGLDHLADAAPPKTTADLQEAAKGYIPDVQAALETAKGYLPAPVANVLPGSSPTSATATSETDSELPPEEKLQQLSLDPTTSAKPADISRIDIDQASTIALPPSTRNASYITNISDNSAATEPGKSLDPTSTAKPADTLPPVSVNGVPGTAVSPASNVNDAAAGLATLPTPPDSKSSTPGPDIASTTQESNGDFLLPRLPSQAGSAVPPTPPPKPESESESKSKSKTTIGTGADGGQPTLNATPQQEHITSGDAGMKIRGTPGTAPVSSGTGIAPSETPNASQLPDSTTKDVSTVGTGHESGVGVGLEKGRGDSESSESVSADGASKEKGSKIRGFISKVKSKVHPHHNEGSN